MQPGTAIFNWKTAKTLIDDDFCAKLKAYQSIGSKDSSYKAYQSISYIEKLIDGINAELVGEYNLVASKLLAWLQLAVENRKSDIVRRRALIHKEREDRDSKIAAKTDRDERRVNELTKAKEAFAEENKEAIETFNAFKTAQENNDNEYDEEEDEGEEGKKEPPTLPKFDEEDYLKKWDEENPEVVI